MAEKIKKTGIENNENNKINRNSKNTRAGNESRGLRKKQELAGETGRQLTTPCAMYITKGCRI